MRLEEGIKNTSKLLAGMSTSTTTRQISTEMPQKSRSRNSKRPNRSCAKNLPSNLNTSNYSDTRIPVLTAAQLITAKSWKLPVHILIDRETVLFMHSRILLYFIGWTGCICRKTDTLEIIILSEVNQKHKLKYQVVYLIWKAQSINN